jgi:FG-GAP repeat
VEIKKLTASDGMYGDSVAVSGDTVVVGARLDDDNGDDSGAAYVYQWDGSDWTLAKKLTASDGTEDDFFGTSVAVSGDTVVVGSGSLTGAAYVYQWNGSDDWVETKKLTAGDGLASDLYGNSVSVSDDRIVVGAQGGDLYTSAAYVYERNGGNDWVETKKLTAGNSSASGSYGNCVSVSGDRIVVGDPAIGFHTGAAWVYQWDGSDCGRKFLFRPLTGRQALISVVPYR